MSNRPGIGAHFVTRIVSELRSTSIREGLRLTVPGQLRIAGKKLPMGRYLREKIREELGLSKKDVEEVVRTSFEMCELQEELFQKDRDKGQTLGQSFRENHKQQVLNQKSRHLPYVKERKL